MATGGTTRGSLPHDFKRTGRHGIMTDIGKGKEPGASRVITPEHNLRGRNWDIKDNRSISTGLRYSSISNRYASSKNNIRLSSRDNSPRRKLVSSKSTRKDLKTRSHNTLGLKTNLKEGEGRTSRSVTTGWGKLKG
jgi:hypothetical protein